MQPCAQLWIVNDKLGGWSWSFPTQQAHFQIQCEWCIPPLHIRAKVRADLAVFLCTCKNTEEMERDTFGGWEQGRFGKVARKQCAYVNKNVCEGSLCDCKYCVGLKLVWSMSLKCLIADSFSCCTASVTINRNWNEDFVYPSIFTY